MAAACSNSKEKSKNTIATTDTTSFYPIASYINLACMMSSVGGVGTNV